MHRVIEAEVWGVRSDVIVSDGITIRQAVGTFGTLYEVTVSSPWGYWRLADYLARWLPKAANYRVLGDYDDEEDDPVLVFHYWEEIESRDRSTASVSQPSF